MAIIITLYTGIFIGFLNALPAQASGVEMADVLRSSGKIYLVVLVVLTILAGVLFYLIRLDKKVSKLEKEINQNTN